MENSRRLAEIPGVVAPVIANLPRAGLAAALDRRGSFPLLLRAPGFHNGRHFVRLETTGGLPNASANSPVTNSPQSNGWMRAAPMENIESTA